MIGSYILVAFLAFIVGAIIGSCYFDTFKIGAEWMQKKMVDKAVKWLTNNWREYVYQDGDGIVHFGHWESDFRKAMEK